MSSLYVRLLCRFQPSAVLAYLQANDAYDVDACLADCLERGVTSAAAFLLERKGDVQSALEIYLRDVDAANAELIKAAVHAPLPTSPGGRGSGMDTSAPPLHVGACVVPVAEFAAAKAALDSAVSMCVRFSQDHVGGASGLAASEPVRRVWLQVLERYVAAVRSLRQEERATMATVQNQGEAAANGRPAAGAAQQLRAADLASNGAVASPDGNQSSALENERTHQLQSLFMSFVEDVISAMSGHISLHSVATAVIERHGGDALGDFRGALLGLLGACNFELTMLNCASRITGSDAVAMLRETYKECMRPSVAGPEPEAVAVPGGNDAMREAAAGSSGMGPAVSFSAIQALGQDAWAKAAAAAGPAASRFLKGV